MLDWRTYEDGIGTVAAAIKDYTGKRQELGKLSGVYAAGFLEKKAADMDTKAGQTIADTFAGLREASAYSLARAKKKATPADVPFEERTYHATAIAQDIAGKKAEDLLPMYEQILKDGNQAKRMEFERLTHGSFTATDAGPAATKYAKLRFDAMTPAESDYHSMRQQADALTAGMSSIEQHAGTVWQSTKEGGILDSGSLARCFEQVKGNVDRAGNLSPLMFLEPGQKTG